MIKHASRPLLLDRKYVTRCSTVTAYNLRTYLLTFYLGESTTYSSDIIKSDIKLISISNISETAENFENDKNKRFSDFYLVHKYVCLEIMRWKFGKLR